MDDRSESVHVHRGDARRTIKEYRQKGYVLKERTKPSVATQIGFVKLIFVPADEATTEAELRRPRKKRHGLLFWFQRGRFKPH